MRVGVGGDKTKYHTRRRGRKQRQSDREGERANSDTATTGDNRVVSNVSIDREGDADIYTHRRIADFNVRRMTVDTTHRSITLHIK